MKRKLQHVAKQTAPLSLQHGFTLIEVLLVVAILAIVSLVTTGYYRNFSKFVELETETKIVASDLKSLRSRAINGELAMRWGVHLVNVNSGNDYYEFFSTPTDYNDAGKIISETHYLNPGINLSDPTVGNTKDVVFERISGNSLSSSTQTVSVVFENQTKTISITSDGTISVN